MKAMGIAANTLRMGDLISAVNALRARLKLPEPGQESTIKHDGGTSVVPEAPSRLAEIMRDSSVITYMPPVFMSTRIQQIIIRFAYATTDRLRRCALARAEDWFQTYAVHVIFVTEV